MKFGHKVIEKKLNKTFPSKRPLKQNRIPWEMKKKDQQQRKNCKFDIQKEMKQRKKFKWKANKIHGGFFLLGGLNTQKSRTILFLYFSSKRKFKENFHSYENSFDVKSQNFNNQ